MYKPPKIPTIAAAIRIISNRSIINELAANLIG